MLYSSCIIRIIIIGAALTYCNAEATSERAEEICLGFIDSCLAQDAEGLRTLLLSSGYDDNMIANDIEEYLTSFRKMAQVLGEVDRSDVGNYAHGSRYVIRIPVNGYGALKGSELLSIDLHVYQIHFEAGEQIVLFHINRYDEDICKIEKVLIGRPANNYIVSIFSRDGVAELIRSIKDAPSKAYGEQVP